MTERWRPPVDEALDMADAFREGVPLGWQRAFVALADAYRGVLADHGNLSHDCADVTAELHDVLAVINRAEIVHGAHGGVRFPAPDGNGSLFCSTPQGVMEHIRAELQTKMDAAEAALPLELRYESLPPRVYRSRQTHNGMEITRSNDWPAPENDAEPDWTYPPLPDIDTAQGNRRRARWSLMIACTLALVVAGLVRFL